MSAVELCQSCLGPCVCRDDLIKAAIGLQVSSEALSNSILSGPDEVTELCLARFRAAKAMLCGALAAYRDHLTEPQSA